MVNDENKKTKWCFLISLYPLLMEFLGKLAHQIIKEGDDCILVSNNKISEYSKLDYFPKDIKIFSKVDWCLENYGSKNSVSAYQENLPEFGDLSWKEIFPDFIRDKLLKFNSEDLNKIISQIYQFLDSVFQKERPDVIVHGMPGSIFAQVVFALCQKYNIAYLSLVHSRLPGRVDIRDSKYQCLKCEKTFQNLKNENIPEDKKNFAKAFISNFVSHKELPSYMHYQLSYRKKSSLGNYFKKEAKMARHWLRYFLKRKQFKKFDYESELIFKDWLLYPWKSLKWRMKTLFPRNIFDSPNENDKFFLFPLNIQPELSTAALASFFYDQLNSIINIAFSLPFPYKLYVKEHPLAFEGRPGNFYKRIKRIPNVVLVSPKESTESLIKKSEGVVVLSSTVGIEAILAGKPLYALGDVFFHYHPLCKRVDSFEELKQKIKMDLAEKQVIKDSDLEEINIRFTLSYFQNTIPGDLFASAMEKDNNNYEAIYKDIKRIFLTAN